MAAYCHPRPLTDSKTSSLNKSHPQVAIGGSSLSALTELWSTALDAKKIGDFQSASENVSENIMTLGKGPLGATEIALMTSLDSSKKPNPSSPSLNHVGLWVDDLAACHAHMTTNGYVFAPGGIRPGADGHNICFLHPKPKEGKGGEGVLIELVQAPVYVVEAWEKEDELEASRAKK